MAVILVPVLPFLDALVKCSLLLIVRHILEIRNEHRSLVSHGGRAYGTSDFANNRAELVPSPWANARNGASRPWLGDNS